MNVMRHECCFYIFILRIHRRLRHEMSAQMLYSDNHSLLTRSSPFKRRQIHLPHKLVSGALPSDSGKCICHVRNKIIRALKTAGHSDQIAGNAACDQLFFGELAVC